MLYGIKHDQKEANFYDQGLGPGDAILIASDLWVGAVMTKLNVQYNRLGDEGKKALRDAAEGREGFELIF